MNQEFKRVSVIGLGYIGLPTAAVLAGRGIEVIGIDVNEKTVQIINDGGIHIVEPGLDIVVSSAVSAKTLRAYTKPQKAEAFVIAVPTPVGKDNSPDISYVEAAVKSIAPVLEKGNLLIIESTSPVGTTEAMLKVLGEMRQDLKMPTEDSSGDIAMAYCPERVLPGHILRELTENDRVIGGISPACAQRAASLYRMFTTGECIITNSRTAEMVKLTENAYRDVNIAFANELSMISDELKINVWELIRLANRHPRVKVLNPGPGVGGHCISVDPWFIVHKSPKLANLIRTAREVNDSKPKFVIQKVRDAIKTSGAKRIACFGLAYKPDIDDFRESPSLHIVEYMARENFGELLIVEPFAASLPTEIAGFKNVKHVSATEALAEADIVLLLVNHSSFRSLNFRTNSKQVVIDTQGMLQ